MDKKKELLFLNIQRKLIKEQQNKENKKLNKKKQYSNTIKKKKTNPMIFDENIFIIT